MTPTWTSPRGDVTLYCADCHDLLRTLPDASVDSVVTDPPYGLKFMGKHWDCDVPGVEVWRECLRVLKPGGHLLCFAGTRTQHRMACAIEDAGFEIRDMLAWVYGQGFPKSLDVSKAIDKAAGMERKVVGPNRFAGRRIEGSGPQNGDTCYGQYGIGVSETAPATPAARQWSGWGTALKPALEPITLARKPLDGTVVENVLAHGTGAINVDGCRIPTNGETPTGSGCRGTSSTWDRQDKGMFDAGRIHIGNVTHASGRWPANLVHDGSEEVLAGFPRTGPARVGGKGGNDPGMWEGKRQIPRGGHDDAGGSAARFFYCAKASRAEREAGLDGTMRRAGSLNLRTDSHSQRNGMDTGPRRNHHPTVKPVSLMRWLCRLVTPPGGIVLDPFMGSGSTGCAAVLEGFRFLGIEREAEYVEIAKRRTATVWEDSDAGLFGPQPLAANEEPAPLLQENA